MISLFIRLAQNLIFSQLGFYWCYWLFNFNRLGISEEAQGTTLSPEDEVNEFLERAIDARSVEQLKKVNVRPIFLKFYKKEFEDKVN